jgi:hypothetical protein
MGYFVLHRNDYDSDDLNQLDCSFGNFKLLCNNTTYDYLRLFALSPLDKLTNIEHGSEVEHPTKYDQQIYDKAMGLYSEMLSSKVIYDTYVEYIKNVLEIIHRDTVLLDELTIALSNYVHISHSCTCHNDKMKDNYFEYIFTTDNHHDELSTYLFETTHPSKEVCIHYYDNSRVTYSLEYRRPLSNESWLIERLNDDYLIPTFKLDLSYSFKNRMKVSQFICKDSLEETLESFYQLVKKKDSKVHMSCVFNKIYYYVE